MKLSEYSKVIIHEKKYFTNTRKKTNGKESVLKVVPVVLRLEIFIEIILIKRNILKKYCQCTRRGFPI